MSKLLVGGVGPRPTPHAKKIYAPGLRFQNFVELLSAQQHEVHLLEASFGGDDSQSIQQENTTLLTGNQASDIERVNQLIQQHQFDAVITSTDYVGNIVSQSNFQGPFWADFFGHPMAERQMQASVAKNNASLADQWQMILPILLRADQFSVCSEAQRLTLIGELGAAGRLNAESCGHEFVSNLYPPVPFSQPFKGTESELLRGKVVPHDAKILLFTGGYNTWLDEKTMFEAIELALGKNPKLHYVSTGGEIQGHVTDIFRRFKERIEQSPHQDRFHFLGWIEHQDFEQCCLESDVGIVVDHPTLEGELGCRNRLYSWIWGGMRSVATDLSEATRKMLVPPGWVHAVPMNDSKTISNAILEEAEKGRLSPEEMAERNELVMQTCSIETCYQPMSDWGATPSNAPDRLEQRVRNPLADQQATFHALQQSNELPELMDRLNGSRLFQLYLRQHPETGDLFRSISEKLQSDKQ